MSDRPTRTTHRGLMVLGIAHGVMFLGALGVLLDSVMGQLNWFIVVPTGAALVWAPLGFWLEYRKRRRARPADGPWPGR